MCHYHMAFQTPSPPGSGPRLPDPRPVSPEYHSRMGSTLWRAEKVELVFSPPVMVCSWRASSWSLAWLSIQAPVSTSPDILAQRGRRMTDHGVCFYIQSWWGHPRADPVLLCELERRWGCQRGCLWAWPHGPVGVGDTNALAQRLSCIVFYSVRLPLVDWLVRWFFWQDDPG